MFGIEGSGVLNKKGLGELTKEEKEDYLKSIVNVLQTTGNVADKDESGVKIGINMGSDENEAKDSEELKAIMAKEALFNLMLKTNSMHCMLHQLYLVGWQSGNPVDNSSAKGFCFLETREAADDFIDNFNHAIMILPNGDKLTKLGDELLTDEQVIAKSMSKLFDHVMKKQNKKD